MATWEIVRLAVWGIGTPVIVYLTVRIVRRIRDINTLDARLREEEKANAQNPYAQMARMYELQQILDEAQGKRRRK
jgi:hypothetical protein